MNRHPWRIVAALERSFCVRELWTTRPYLSAVRRQYNNRLRGSVWLSVGLSEAWLYLNTTTGPICAPVWLWVRLVASCAPRVGVCREGVQKLPPQRIATAPHRQGFTGGHLRWVCDDVYMSISSYVRIVIYIIYYYILICSYCHMTTITPIH